MQLGRKRLGDHQPTGNQRAINGQASKNTETAKKTKEKQTLNRT
jgi:hypothetical protein